MNRSSFLIRCLEHARSSCPVHRQRTPGGIRQVHTFTNQELKRLLPTMDDLLLHRGDTVTMAMSGGVDSAVSLRILSEFPIDLGVVYMRNWDPLLSESPPDDATENHRQPTSLAYSSQASSSSSPPSSRPTFSPCSWEKDWEDVRAVCRHVGIPSDRVRLVDLSRDYWTRVFQPAINIWERGGTPNPDVACNREIKFGALLKHIPKKSRSFIATGHYARVKRVPHATRLCRADDMDKDQTYYLSSITDHQLSRAIFPLGEITKPEVRQLAEFYGLPNAKREESMGLCFVGERDKFGHFLSQYMPPPTSQGYLIDSKGKRLAPHDGLWNFTIGQRARIGGMEEAMFVAKKGVGETEQDILVVPGSDNPALMCTRLHTHDFHWIHRKVPKGIVPGATKRASVQVRHRMEPVSGVISHDWDGKGITIDFPEPVSGVATGQVVAIWYQKWCIGSGIIEETWTSDQIAPKTWQEHKEQRPSRFNSIPFSDPDAPNPAGEYADMSAPDLRKAMEDELQGRVKKPFAKKEKKRKKPHLPVDVVTMPEMEGLSLEERVERLNQEWKVWDRKDTKYWK